MRGVSIQLSLLLVTALVIIHCMGAERNSNSVKWKNQQKQNNGKMKTMANTTNYKKGSTRSENKNSNVNRNYSDNGKMKTIANTTTYKKGSTRSKNKNSNVNRNDFSSSPASKKTQSKSKQKTKDSRKKANAGANPRNSKNLYQNNYLNKKIQGLAVQDDALVIVPIDGGDETGQYPGSQSTNQNIDVIIDTGSTGHNDVIIIDGATVPVDVGTGGNGIEIIEVVPESESGGDGETIIVVADGDETNWPTTIPPVIELTTEINPMPSELITDMPDELITDMPGELITEMPSELITEMPDELITDMPGELITEMPSELVTDMVPSPEDLVTDMTPVAVELSTFMEDNTIQSNTDPPTTVFGPGYFTSPDPYVTASTLDPNVAASTPNPNVAVSSPDPNFAISTPNPNVALSTATELLFMVTDTTTSLYTTTSPYTTTTPSSITVPPTNSSCQCTIVIHNHFYNNNYYYNYGSSDDYDSFDTTYQPDYSDSFTGSNWNPAAGTLYSMQNTNQFPNNKKQKNGRRPGGRQVRKNTKQGKRVGNKRRQNVDGAGSQRRLFTRKMAPRNLATAGGAGNLAVYRVQKRKGQKPVVQKLRRSKRQTYRVITPKIAKMQGVKTLKWKTVPQWKANKMKASNRSIKIGHIQPRRIASASASARKRASARRNMKSRKIAKKLKFNNNVLKQNKKLGTKFGMKPLNLGISRQLQRRRGKNVG